MTPTHLVTHSGGFHADELLSSVILSRVFPDAQIVRSRAKDWITPADDRIIFDVGGDYDAEKGIFDHHQRGAPRREDDQPYSSFGLIWKHFGLDYLVAVGVPEEHRSGVHTSFDKSFVLPIDLADNGDLDLSTAGQMAGLTLPALLESLKPVFDDTSADAETHAFMNALAIARAFVEARIARSAAKRRAEGLVAQAIADAGENHVLELPMGMPFRGGVTKAGADHLLFVITPRENNDWTLGGIRLGDHGFELRADLPAAWAGLNGSDLEAATGVQGATFCHNGLFIAAATSREAIVAMADLAVKDAQARMAEA